MNFVQTTSYVFHKRFAQQSLPNQNRFVDLKHDKLILSTTVHVQ